MKKSSSTKTNAKSIAKKPLKRMRYPVPKGKLVSWPDDFDSSKHKPLRRTDFADEAVWLEKQLSDLDSEIFALKKKRDDLAVELERHEKYGSERARKIQRVLDSVQELRKQGVDIDEMLTDE